MRIMLSTGGGDAPGLNAVIRAAVLSAVNRGWEVLGIKKGYAGLLGEEEVIPMTAATVRGIAHLGGTRVEIDHDTVLTARATGISFGD
jgi:ATP-dependent phosphofructokinase / diphosphate-dependent phosphofructokinase